MRKKVKCPQCNGKGEVDNAAYAYFYHILAPQTALEDVINYINKIYQDAPNCKNKVVSIVPYGNRWLVLFENYDYFGE